MVHLKRVAPHIGIEVQPLSADYDYRRHLAEIVAVRRARRGGFLKDRPGPIHDRVAQARAPGAMPSRR